MRNIIITFYRKVYFNYLRLRKNIFIRSNKASVKALYSERVLVDKDCFVSSDVNIGRYSYINKNSSVECCNIGSFCSISSNVYISPIEHDYSCVTTHPFPFNPFYGVVDCVSYPSNCEARTEIGNDVWIGLNVIVRKGVKIGNGSIIGAGAVVICDVPNYEIWGGVPAKKLKDRFSKDKADMLNKSEWWNWNIQKIKKHLHLFTDSDAFVITIKSGIYV